MRIRVRFEYDPFGNCNLIREFADGNTEFYQTIAPETVVHEAGAWFFAQPIRYAGEPMICLVQIDKESALLPHSELREKCRGALGSILKPGLVCLWATSEHSLARGLVHPYSEKYDDPIAHALRKMGFSGRRFSEVDRIDFSFVNHRGGRYDFVADPSSRIGRQNFGSILRVTRISGGSWLILRLLVRTDAGPVPKQVTNVLVTKDADREEVAKIVRNSIPKEIVA